MHPKLFLVTFAVLLALLSLANAIGFPSGGGGGGGCCCCGGGGGVCGGGCGGGCGRRKRDTDAIQPHYKADETPCPQTAWKELLEENITAEDAVASVNAIQTALYRRYVDEHKFMVTCTTAKDEVKMAANQVHFSSSGDGYCNTVKEKVWCQAVALSA
ncbi:hypothetical protein niasHT_035306 [Heterodera trifolii]|uniref:Ground-like domain-containing protein n=1 Tax=Heterodera trifolii TaxID=157864 RepID=A0ABD2I686_9BILA